MGSIAIRMVQHFLYCPHRWGLLEIDRAWAENYFVVKADLLHKRTHDPEKSYTIRGKKVFTDVPIWNDQPEYDLYGVTDCLEATRDANGVAIDDSGETYRLCLVEYKPTKPKDRDFHPEDAMQLYEQKLCVDSVFGGDCDAVLYYADVRKRIPVPLREQKEAFDKTLKDALTQMRRYEEAGVIPPIRKGQKCSGCSMKDLCMPKSGKKKSLRDEIAVCLREDTV